jgi:hypothetical protein
MGILKRKPKTADGKDYDELYKEFYDYNDLLSGTGEKYSPEGIRNPKNTRKQPRGIRPWNR